MPRGNHAEPHSAGMLCTVVEVAYALKVVEVTLLGVSENHAYRLTGPLGERWFCRVHGDDPSYDACLPGLI